MKKQDLYNFINTKRLGRLDDVNDKIEAYKTSRSLEIYDEIGMDGYIDLIKESVELSTELFNLMQKAGLDHNVTAHGWANARKSYVQKEFIDVMELNKKNVLIMFEWNLKNDDTLVELNKEKNRIGDEFNALTNNVKRLSTAKRGYDLLIQTGFNKEELDSFIEPVAVNAVMIQSFDKNALFGGDNGNK